MAHLSKNASDWQFAEVFRALSLLLSGQGIDAALACLGEGAGVDRVYIFSLHPHPKTGELACSQLYEWCRRGVQPQIDNPELQDLPIERAGFHRWLEELTAGRVIFGNIDDFPESEKSLLQAQGIKSILVAPITCGKEFWGFIGFDSVHQCRVWGEEHREILLSAAASLGYYLRREAAEEKIREMEERWRTLLHHIPDALVVHDGGQVLFANEAAHKLFGLPAGETLVGRPGKRLIHESSWRLVEERVRTMMAQNEPAPILELTYTREDGGAFIAETRSMPVELGGRRVIVSVIRDLGEKKRWLEQIQYLAYHDSLTDLPNRRLLKERSEHILALAARHKFPVALGYLDLDRFKEVNDALGHDAGDELLQAVAVRLSRMARETDVVARLGGDEFGILCPQTGHEGARQVARRILACFAQPFVVGKELVSIEASVGIAVFPSDGHTLQTLMRCADVAMYRAKAANSGYAFYSPELDGYSRARLAFLEKVKKALREKRVGFYFQPILSCRTGEVRFAETLARLEEDGEVIAASAFVPLLYELGQVGELDKLALHHGVLAAERLRLPVTVNVAGPSLLAPSFVDELKTLLQEKKLAPSQLCLEVTESFVVEGAEQVLGILQEIRSLGVPIALDDFGQAYSSLALLRDVATDLVKLDATFINAAREDARSRTLLAGIIELAHKLGVKVVAEGVENREQYELLQVMDCDFIQGFHFAPALPLNDARWSFLQN